MSSNMSTSSNDGVRRRKIEEFDYTIFREKFCNVIICFVGSFSIVEQFRRRSIDDSSIGICHSARSADETFVLIQYFLNLRLATPSRESRCLFKITDGAAKVMKATRISIVDVSQNNPDRLLSLL